MLSFRVRSGCVVGSALNEAVLSKVFQASGGSEVKFAARSLGYHIRVRTVPSQRGLLQ